MPDQAQLDELLDRWESRWEAGEEATAEELCAAAPELAGELNLQIAALKATDWLRDDATTMDSVASGETSEDRAALEQSLDDLPASKLDLAAFTDALVARELLTQSQLAEFRDALPADQRCTTACELAAALIARGLLTRYQAGVLLSQSGDPLVLDRYVVLDALDAGGMGVVFKALHRSLDRVVALKVLPSGAVDSPDKVRRFRREARAVASLSHPNIVTAHDAAEADGVHFLVMEYVAGENLVRGMKRDGPMSLVAAVRCILQAARGLEHAHRRGIVHRDVKPANLLLAADGTVKVLDLGLARIDGPREAGDSHDLTREGATMGTVAFMAPEQALDSRAADERSDVYSLGCTLYFLLTGQPPYRGETPMQTLVAHREQSVPSLRETRSEVDAELDALLRRMLAKQPTDRPQSMTEVCAALESWLGRRHEQDSGRADSGEPGAPARSAASNDRHPFTAESLPSTVTLPPRAAVPAPRHERPRRSRALVGLAAASIAVAVFAGVLIKLATRDGTLTIELPDSGEYQVLIDGEQAEIVARDGRTLTVSVPPGKRQLLVTLADGTELRTDAEDGFTMAAGGGGQIRVWLELPAEAVVETTDGSDDDRQVAAWVLSVGGHVTVGDDVPVWYDVGTRVKAGDALPEEPFRLYSATLFSSSVSDAALVRLRDAPRLNALVLNGAGFTGAGLAQLRSLAELHWVDLQGMPITADGAAALATLPRLKTLFLSPTSCDAAAWEAVCALSQLERLSIWGGELTGEQLQRIESLDDLANLAIAFQPNLTDDRLHFLPGLSELKILAINHCPVTAAGLATVADIGSLEVLYLVAMPLEDDGIAQLARLTHLRVLGLTECTMTDAAVSQLGGMSALEVLDLTGSSVTDSGLQHLRGLRGLKSLILSTTRVTAEGVAALQMALSDCKIDWSPTDPDRVAAEWALSAGGLITISIAGQDRVLSDDVPLPNEEFRLTRVEFGAHARVTDDGLAVLRGLPGLKSINLHGLPVTDRGLAALGPQPALDYLVLSELPISDMGIATVVAAMPQLTSLVIRDVAITDAGAEHLPALKKLRSLELRGAQITDAGIRHLARLPSLSELRVAGTPIGDESLAVLGKECWLNYLDVGHTQVTAEGLVHLLPMPGLYGLWLDGIPMTAEGLELLGQMTSLRGLILADCGLTDDLLPSLSALQQLKQLSVAGNPLSPAAVEQLRTALPDCEITWSPPAEKADEAAE